MLYYLLFNISLDTSFLRESDYISFLNSNSKFEVTSTTVTVFAIQTVEKLKKKKRKDSEFEQKVWWPSR